MNADTPLHNVEKKRLDLLESCTMTMWKRPAFASLRHRSSTNTRNLWFVALAGQIMNSLLFRSWGQVLCPLLTFCAGSVGLLDASCARLQEKVVCRDQVLALRRLPFGTLSWRYMRDVHGIDFFQSATLMLFEEEVHNRCCGEGACREDVSVSEIDR